MMFRNVAVGIAGTSLALASLADHGFAADERTEIEQFIEAWRKAWEATPKDGVEPMRRFYHPKFVKLDKRRNREQLLKRLKVQASTAKEIRVTLSNVKIGKPSKGRLPRVTVKFRQEYDIENYHEEGEKTLVLQHENGAWNILKENFVEDGSLLLALKAWIVKQDMLIAKDQKWFSVQISWSGFEAEGGSCERLIYNFKKILRESASRIRIWTRGGWRAHDCHDSSDLEDAVWFATRDVRGNWAFDVKFPFELDEVTKSRNSGGRGAARD
ncbi:MAG: hypothetical protein HYY84_05130 [Deltaproteobacteria bacterium]|nr:hypothetical protein [Deltaproteobacteria bacterium]